jgi:hypothetical protein
MEQNMFPFYPLGDIKVPVEEIAQKPSNSEKND